MRRAIDHPLVQFLIGDSTVIFVISLNAIMLFLDAFPAIHALTGGMLEWVDFLCVLYFFIEASLKIWVYSFKVYWRNNWNKFDFTVTLISLPILLGPFIHNDMDVFSIFIIVRLGRFLRLFRLFRFIPHAESIWQGVVRALKASVGVFAVLFALNVVLALGATILFDDIAPEYFSNPLISIYSLFKVFTVEGWYEIPDSVAQQNKIGFYVGLMRFYFILTVVVGGVLGLSLANAIFVDEMTADNNDELEKKVSALKAELQAFRQETFEFQVERLNALQTSLDTLQKDLAEARSSD